MRALLSAFLIFAAACASAGDPWSATDIQLLHGDGYKFGSSQRTTVTIEHAQGKDGDDIYMFVDLIDRDDIGSEVYGEIYGQKSLWQPKNGPLGNVSLSLGLNADSEPDNDPYVAYLAGISLDFKIPGFSFFQLDVHAFKEDGLDSFGWQFTPVWDVPFRLGRLGFRFRGFADILTADTNRNHQWNVITQPQLLLDVGQMFDHANHFYAGVEYQYWHNKFGVRGMDERLPNVMLMYAF